MTDHDWRPARLSGPASRDALAAAPTQGVDHLDGAGRRKGTVMGTALGMGLEIALFDMGLWLLVSRRHLEAWSGVASLLAAAYFIARVLTETMW